MRESKTNSSEDMGLDHHGNQRYSSPECSINSIEDEQGPNWITQKADIFSFGAVLSDCAAWIAGGRDFQDQYWRRRCLHHKKANTFRKKEYRGCFHDGIKPLVVIKEVHDDIRQKCSSAADRITHQVVDMIEQSMLLQSRHDRWDARQLTTAFDQILRSFESHLSPTSPTSPVSDKTSLSQKTTPATTTAKTIPESGAGTAEKNAVRQRPRPPPRIQVTGCSTSGNGVAQLHPIDPRNSIHSTRSSLLPPESGGSQSVGTSRNSDGSSPIEELSDKFGIPELGQYREDSKNGKEVNTESQRVMEYIRENLQGRDQFFFIDNSTSMEIHRQTVKGGFEALSHLAKRLDPNKVELSFTSNPCHVHRYKKTKKLAKILAKRNFIGNPHIMEEKFDLLVQQIIKYLPYRRWGFNLNLFSRKRLSIYIFTDGNWGDDDKACGVEKPLERLMREIKRRNLPRNQVSLHFVRFGNFENGKRHLNYLDDLGNKDDWDIVDVKHISDPVHAIAFGPIDPVNDSKVYNN